MAPQPLPLTSTCIVVALGLYYLNVTRILPAKFIPGAKFLAWLVYDHPGLLVWSSLCFALAVFEGRKTWVRNATKEYIIPLVDGIFDIMMFTCLIIAEGMRLDKTRAGPAEPGWKDPVLFIPAVIFFDTLLLGALSELWVGTIVLTQLAMGAGALGYCAPQESFIAQQLEESAGAHLQDRRSVV
ncbi:hypothetical protein IAT38_003154 [Cryptococcus sp. DSM 104549]